MHRRGEPGLEAPGATPDEQLAERARDGDRAAFEELVHRHADRLYAVILRFTASADEAEEATQEAFLRAWRSIGGFEGRSQFFTWLYRIGINEAKRRAQRGSTEPSTASVEQDRVQELPDSREGPQAHAELSDLRGELQAAVRALPFKYRAPLILRDVEGLSTAQAAEIMGLREAAFKSRLHRARLAVRRALDKDYPA
jgi:RNA polymerase sigma factor (sigma-70 family)